MEMGLLFPRLPAYHLGPAHPLFRTGAYTSLLTPPLACIHAGVIPSAESSWHHAFSSWQQGGELQQDKSGSTRHHPRFPRMVHALFCTLSCCLPF